jgi:hypothetical protein
MIFHNVANNERHRQENHRPLVELSKFYISMSVFVLELTRCRIDKLDLAASPSGPAEKLKVVELF